jgi:hypothetical protein
VKDPDDGGRSYYRNISLVSAWAHAPFMHNNAIGPELCAKPANPANDFYRSPYVDADKQTLPAGKAPACWAYDPSVEGRFKLFVASAEELLNPASRAPKLARFDKDVVIPIGPRLWDGDEERQVVGFTVTIPAGTSVGGMANLQHKQLAGDLVLALRNPDALDAKLTKRLGADRAKAVAADLRSLGAAAVKNPASLVTAVRSRPELLAAYSSCTADIENVGHRFGEDLSDRDKKALIAFLATL